MIGILARLLEESRHNMAITTAHHGWGYVRATLGGRNGRRGRSQKTYGRYNHARECARRRRQLEAGQLHYEPIRAQQKGAT